MSRESLRIQPEKALASTFWLVDIILDYAIAAQYGVKEPIDSQVLPMTQFRWQQTNPFSGKLLCTSMLGLSLVFTSTALAQFTPSQPSRPSRATGAGGTRYVPPVHPSRPSRSVGSTGTRGGCGKATDTSLIALAPVSHNGQTVSAHPTFVWYVTDQSTSWVEFALYEIDARGDYKRLYRQQLESTQDRIRQFTLPEDVPGLSDRQTYLWQVALLCDPGNPARDRLAKATIDVVALPPSLKAALAQTPDHLKRADLYAQAGLWYDALAEALAGASGSKLVWLGLVESLSRSETAEPAAETRRQVEIMKQREQLQKIVLLEQR